MTGLPTEVTAEYDRLLMENDSDGVQLLLAPLVQSRDAEGLYLWSMSSLPGEGEEAYEARHLNLVSKAAEAGYAPAQFTRGMYYLFGDFGAIDAALAAECFAAASNQGYPPAQYEYGLALLHGVGVSANKGEAMRLIRSAAAAGNQYAQQFLQSSREADNAKDDHE
jgi:TPR repeat protein